jgi:hypothetical protein
MTPRRGLVWPLLLIIIGVVFLLANFGYIAPISVIGLLSLWPLLLIIVGIDIAIGRRWPLAALAADVLVIAVGLSLVTLQPGGPGGMFPVAVFSSEGGGDSTVDVPRSDVKTMTLRLSAGAASVEIRGGATQLVHAESDRNDLRLRSATRVGDRMDVRIDQGFSSGFKFGPAVTSHVLVTVPNDVPVSLTVDAGAGEFVVDLSNVKATDVRISVGAASLRVVLPRPTGDVPVTISAGASSVVIEIPSGVEARITTSGGLTATHIDNARVSGSETSGYPSGTDRVTVRVSAGASSITVR